MHATGKAAMALLSNAIVKDLESTPGGYFEPNAIASGDNTCSPPHYRAGKFSSVPVTLKESHAWTSSCWLADRKSASLLNGSLATIGRGVEQVHPVRAVQTIVGRYGAEVDFRVFGDSDREMEREFRSLLWL